MCFGVSDSNCCSSLTTDPDTVALFYRLVTVQASRYLVTHARMPVCPRPLPPIAHSAACPGSRQCRATQAMALAGGTACLYAQYAAQTYAIHLKQILRRNAKRLSRGVPHRQGTLAGAARHLACNIAEGPRPVWSRVGEAAPLRRPPARRSCRKDRCGCPA